MLAAFAVTMPAVAADTTIVPFLIGGVALELPTPAGYCVPTGQEAAVAQLVAAADNVNVTDLTLVRCGADAQAALEDYSIIKTPTRSLLATVSRDELLAALSAEFDKPEFKEFLSKQVMPSTEKQYRDLGAEITMSGSPRPLGRDDVCAYMGGEITPADKSGKTYPTLMGGCITAVGGKVISVFRYVVPGKGKDVGALLREARALALQVRTAPAK